MLGNRRLGGLRNRAPRGTVGPLGCWGSGGHWELRDRDPEGFGWCGGGTGDIGDTQREGWEGTPGVGGCGWNLGEGTPGVPRVPWECPGCPQREASLLSPAGGGGSPPRGVPACPQEGPACPQGEGSRMSPGGVPHVPWGALHLLKKKGGPHVSHEGPACPQESLSHLPAPFHSRDRPRCPQAEVARGMSLVSPGVPPRTALDTAVPAR